MALHLWCSGSATRVNHSYSSRDLWWLHSSHGDKN